MKNLVYEFHDLLGDKLNINDVVAFYVFKTRKLVVGVIKEFNRSAMTCVYLDKGEEVISRPNHVIKLNSEMLTKWLMNNS